MPTPPPRKPNPPGRPRGGSGPRGGIRLKRSADGRGWLLSHPESVRERAEDIEEVRAIIAAGETDVAVDELRWLLADCHEMIEAHFLLGKLAVEADNDLALARGHFGFGYSLGEKAWRKAGSPQPIPALHPANRPFFDSGRGLAWCLRELDKADVAREVLTTLRTMDPADPLGVGAWLDELATAATPLVTLTGLLGGR